MESVMKLVILGIFILSTFSSLTSFAHSDSFIDSVENATLREVKAMLDNGSNPNYSFDGKPVIFFAVEAARVEMFKLLIMYGADVNAKKTSDGVVNNNLLMSAIKAHAKNDSKLKMTKIINTLLDNEFIVANKKYLLNFNPYGLGGIDNKRDVVSVIAQSSGSANSLELVYNHKKIDPSKFSFRSIDLQSLVENGNTRFLNLYLQYNSNKVSASLALDSLETLSFDFSNNPALVNTELIGRLRNIAF
jgi:ankyrin repeat protein